MASVFNKGPDKELSVIDIVEDTLDVDGNGNVSFRTRQGKGSGATTKIPSEQFVKFISLLSSTEETRSALAEQQRELDSDIPQEAE